MTGVRWVFRRGAVAVYIWDAIDRVSRTASTGSQRPTPATLAGKLGVQGVPGSQLQPNILGRTGPNAHKLLSDRNLIGMGLAPVADQPRR
jgi:hypothetical protein